MRRLVYFLAITLLLLSCSHKNNSAKNPIRNIVINNLLVAKFLPIICGRWVKKDYIEGVTLTKSPAGVYKLANGITELIINADSVKGDSMVVNCGWNNHEWGELMLKFKAGKRSNTLQLDIYNLGYSIANNDTTLVLYGVDDVTHVKTSTRYIRIRNNETMASQINKVLISGKYRLADSTGVNGIVTFTNIGSVTGFLNFSTYFVNDDLNLQPMSNLDEIIFYPAKSAVSSYVFKITADTLNLYNFYANSDSTEMITGKIAYKLIRQR